MRIKFIISPTTDDGKPIIVDGKYPVSLYKNIEWVVPSDTIDIEDLECVVHSIYHYVGRHICVEVRPRAWQGSAVISFALTQMLKSGGWRTHP
jgi:hypothetical protein